MEGMGWDRVSGTGQRRTTKDWYPTKSGIFSNLVSRVLTRNS